MAFSFATLPVLLKLFVLFTILGQAIIVLYALGLIVQHVFKKKSARIRAIGSVWKTYGVHLSFLVAATATLGSLYLSEVLLWVPCELCWFQRILMYPLSLIFLVGILKKGHVRV